MKVHEIMTAHARCVAPDNTLVEAAGLMRELDVGVLPVCDQDRLAGMVTDRDMVLRGLADGRDPNTTAVREVMSEGVTWVFADQDVEEVARVMEEKQIRRLPVLNREKRLVGIVSLGDIAISSNPAFSGTALRDVSEPTNPTARQRRLAERSEMPRMPARTESAAERKSATRGTRRTSGSARRKSSRATTGAARQRKRTTRGRAKSSAARRGSRRTPSRAAR